MSQIKNLARKIIPKRALRTTEDIYRLEKAKTANLIYNFPAKNMRVVAVTGTNGKTTTCTFINEILKAGGYKTAVYTTAYIEINDKNEPNKTHMTIASVWSVQKFMTRAKKASVDWVVLEVTSHALDQYRIHGVPVEVVAITNLTQDHLDYHGTMKNYAAAKARLITEFDPKITVLNTDDEWFGYFAQKVKRGLLRVGKSRASEQIKDLHLTSSGTEFSLKSDNGLLKINTHLIGQFNAHNAAIAATVGQALGLSKDQIQKGIASVPVVPGRLEPINVGQSFMVLVDFAVTPDALQKVLSALKMVVKGKIRIVFGATGDRDKAKRPIMGEVVALLADKIYLTDDETYTEVPDDIRSAIKAGIKNVGGLGKVIEIPDRREAIKKALSEAQKDDVVLLAGIGSEDYRNMGGKKIPWDERQVAREILKELK